MSSPLLRALVLRLFGLLVFALVGLGAASLMASAIAGSESPLIDGAVSFSGWVSGSLPEWVAILVGVGLVILAGVLFVIMLPWGPSTRTRFVMRTGSGGKTMLDLSSVAQAVQTDLNNSVDNKITVGVRRGRLRVVTPFAPDRPFDLVDQAGTSVKQKLKGLGLEEIVRYEVTTGSETKRRVQ